MKKLLSALSLRGFSRSNPVIKSATVILNLIQNLCVYLSGFRVKHGMTAGVVLAMTVAVLLSPNNLAQAAESSSDLTLKVGEVISLSISSPCDSASYSGNDVTISLTPKSTGTFSSCPNVITVGTNTTGFQLLFKASGVNLVNTITSSYTIPSTTNTTPNKLVVNTWGYAIPASASASHDVIGIPSAILSVFDSSYATRTDTNPIPADKYAKTPLTDSIIKKVDNTITNPTLQNNQTTVYYAAAIDLTTRSGTYRANITYTAVGEEIPEPLNYLAQVTARRNITTLQGLTGDICSLVDWDSASKGINDNNTATLTDIRNDQPYDVRKMADQKCWMIDNLKLELGVVNADPTKDTTVLEPANTSVSEPKTVDFDWPNFNQNSAAHVGGFVTGGALTKSGALLTTSPNLDAWRQVDISNISNCLNNPSGKTYDPASKTKCGYLYNWYAAVAGTATQSSHTVHGNVAQGSICPANWRLPRAYSGTTDTDTNTNTANGDFAVLDSSMEYGRLAVGNMSSYYAGWQPAGEFRTVLSGDWRTSSEYLDYGYLWSSTAFTAREARNASFGAGYINANSYNERYYGFGVRCVVGT